ncbi:MAG: hypothetical protein C0624_13105 [Desulfuromonas sp.]|nr:MAG: hypothetical protein C0624_13105 [Desulfuromonas sp.]
MTPLDTALQNLRENPDSNESRNDFYRLFLSSTFYLPTYDEETGGVSVNKNDEKMLPLIMEAEGENFMMIFDLEERVADWAEEGVHCIALPGHVIVEMATEGLHLAMNVGTEQAKQFVPEEISWLKEVVKQGRDAAEAEDQSQKKQ